MSAENPAPAQVSGNREAILADLKACLVEVADGKLDGVEIDPAGNLLEYGYLDSLGAVMFLAHVADRYGVEIEDVELVERLHNLDAVIDHLIEHSV